MNDIEFTHYPECEEQPDGFPCICSHIADKMREEADQARIDDENQDE